MQGPALPAAAQPIFYYDLGSPRCYLMAEQVLHALPSVPEWEPVLSSTIEDGPPVPIDRAEIEREAQESGLQQIRWPRTVPPDTRLAMLAATYAKQIGRGVSFSLAAFRQAFAGGHDLSLTDTVLIAGAACEMHPAALLGSLERRAVVRALDEASARARQAGVRSLPAIRVFDVVFSGAGALERAGQALMAQPDERGGRPA